MGIDTTGHPSCRRLLARYSGAGASLAETGAYRLAGRNDLLLLLQSAHLSDEDVDEDDVDDGDDLALVMCACSRATISRASLVARRGILKDPLRRTLTSFPEISRCVKLLISVLILYFYFNVFSLLNYSAVFFFLSSTFLQQTFISERTICFRDVSLRINLINSCSSDRILELILRVSIMPRCNKRVSKIQFQRYALSSTHTNGCFLNSLTVHSALCMSKIIGYSPCVDFLLHVHVQNRD